MVAQWWRITDMNARILPCVSSVHTSICSRIFRLVCDSSWGSLWSGKCLLGIQTVEISLVITRSYCLIYKFKRTKVNALTCYILTLCMIFPNSQCWTNARFPYTAISLNCSQDIIFWKLIIFVLHSIRSSWSEDTLQWPGEPLRVAWAPFNHCTERERFPDHA